MAKGTVALLSQNNQYYWQIQTGIDERSSMRSGAHFLYLRNFYTYGNTRKFTLLQKAFEF